MKCNTHGANMKHGIEKASGSVTFIVSHEMTAHLDGREVHPVYSTFWACYHAEVAARRAIEPYFGIDENAVGSALTMQHLSMAAVGTIICVTAQVVSIKGNRILCDIEIRTVESNAVLARGTQEQVVMPTSKLEQLVLKARSS
ncbi:MAG: hypothetical protein FJ211_04515 [Ignavibacteria bacterium]|nr:hypothetical protein [Ignavibacteria bacterium]